MSLSSLNSAVLLLALIWLAGCQTAERTATPVVSRRDLRSLPGNLSSLRQATGYLDWEGVRGYSRSLTHYRHLRFDKGSNVFISETGAKAGQVDVVEVILMPLTSDSKVEFALYDPNSGSRITQYPDSVVFDVERIHGSSRNAAPDLCVACHDERKPLIALILWNRTLEDDLKRSRATGQGIRQDLMVPVPNDEATRDRITAFNKIMQDSFPDQINDIREWMAIRTRPEAEPDGAANGSQPTRSETNRTPPAAGSRR